MSPKHPLLRCLSIIIGLSLANSICFSNDLPNDRLIVHNQESIEASIARYQANDPATVNLVEALRITVETKYIDLAPTSVVDKPIAPASGDKKDYMSMSPYWWPDPNTEGGLPYIRKDGVVNPMRNELDNVSMDTMANGSWFCSLLYTYTGEEKYAKKAADFLRAWFLNAETRMNPNLKYSQSRPGYTNLRASALLDSQRMLRMIDSSPLLLKSDSWTIEDHHALQAWFAEYTQWFHTSEQGIGEAQATNNHGSYYDTQLICFAAFAGDHELAVKTLKQMTPVRIAQQLENDGSQPHELERTRPFHYTTFNITSWVIAAQIGDQYGIDVWAPKDEKSIGRALEWLKPYATGETEWFKLTPILERDKLVYRYLIQLSADHYPFLDKDAILAKLPNFDYESHRHLRYIAECELAR